MTVRILFERTVDPGKRQVELLDLMRELRAKWSRVNPLGTFSTFATKSSNSAKPIGV